MKFDKQAELVSRLYKSTVDGKLDWKPAVREGAFQVSFPTYTVVLAADGADYYIEIINDNGDSIENFSDMDLTKGSDISGQINSSWFATMREMEVMARRRALGADKALDDLLRELSPE